MATTGRARWRYLPPPRRGRFAFTKPGAQALTEAATIGGITTPAPSTASATITSVSVAPNSQILFTAGSDFPGVLGNNVWVEITPNDSLGATRVTAFGTTDNPHMLIEAPSVSGVITATAGSIITAVNAYQPNRLIAANAAGSDGTGIASAWNTGPNSGYYALYLNIPDVAQYAETGIVGSVTTPSSVDVYTPGGVAYTEAATLSSATTVTSVDSEASVDSDIAVIKTTTVPATLDVSAFVESATLSSKTSLSAVEPAGFVESATLSSATKVSSSEITAYTPESATLATKTTLVGTDIPANIDTTTIAVVTVPSGTEVYTKFVLTDAATIGGITTPSVIQSFPTTPVLDDFNQAANTSPPSSQWSLYKLAAPTNNLIAVGDGTVSADETGVHYSGGYWNVAQFLDSEIYIRVSAADVADDSGIFLAARGSAANYASGAETGFYELQWPPDGSGVFMRDGQPIDDFWSDEPPFVGYPYNNGDSLGFRVRGTNPVILEAWYKSGTGPWKMIYSFADADPGRITTPGYVGFSISPVARVDSFGGGAILGSPTDIHELSDNATIASVTTPGGSDVYTLGSVAYTETATIASVTTLASVEIHEIPDSATVSSKTTPISVEIAAYTDTNTISGATSVSTTESTQYADANTGATTTAVTSSDVATLVDSALLATTTTLSSADLAAYTDNATGTSTTQPSTVELHEIPDSGIVGCTTTPSATDVAAYVDANTTTAITSITSFEGGGAGDTNTFATTTSLSYTEIAAYTDNATLAGVTSLSFTDVHEIPDSSTISGTTVVTPADVAVLIDAASISTATAISSTEIGLDTDSAIVAGTTAVSGVEVLPATSGITELGRQITSGGVGISISGLSDINVGDDIIVVVLDMMNSVVATPTDNGSNTWTQLSATATPTTVYRLSAFYCNVVTPFTSVSYVRNSGAKIMWLFSISGLAAGAALDILNKGTNGTSINPKSLASGALAQSDEFVLGFFGTVGTPTWLGDTTAGFTDLGVVTNPAGSGGQLAAEWKEVSTTASITPDGTLGTSVPWAGGMASFLVSGGITRTDSATIPGVSGVSSSVEVAPSDAATISGVSNVSATEVATFVDTGAIAATTTPSTVDISSLLDASTISGTTTFAGSDVTAYVDSGTIVSNSIGTAGEVGAYIDSALAGGITTPISDEQILHGNQDISTLATVTTLGSVEVAAYVDTATSQTITTPSSIELRAISDAATVATSSVLSSVETTQFVDAGTNTSVTTLSATEVKEITDAGTVNGVTTLTSVEVVPGTDAQTVTSVTSFAAIVEVHEIPDSNTVTGITTPSAVEVMVVADFGTPGSATTISSTDLAAYVDTQVVSSVTTPSGVETSTSGKTDADTVVDTTTLSAADVAVFVDQNTISGKTGVTSSEGGFSDSNTIPIFTIPTASDIAFTVDNRIINSVTSLSTIEQATDTDNGIVSNTSTLIYSDISAYVESAAIVGTTSYSGTELSGVDYSDTTTIPTKTAVNYIEQSVYVETSTLVTRTSLTDLEITVYTDSSTVTTDTSVESTEFAKAPTFDAATISSITIPGIVVEYAVKLSELVVVSYYVRWQSTSTLLRWSTPVRSFVRWSAKPLQSRFAEKVSRKWAAWTH